MDENIDTCDPNVYNRVMKLHNIILALRDQLPLARLLRNTLNGNLRGLVHVRSHQNHDGRPKVAYGSKASAIRAAESMMRKHGGYFSNYKCMRCDGYHIGKNR